MLWAGRMRFEIQEGVAVPDRYVKFASLGWNVSRPPGYPAETNPPSRYGLSLYWDGIQHGRDGSGKTQVAPAKTLPFVRVTDVGPWNTDDNWWDSYSDPQRPRRINSKGILFGKTEFGGGGPDYLAGRPHLAYGMPEAQFAYFNNTDRYYGTPNPRPAGTWNPDGTPLNYWGSPSGGTWRGVDQFGRQVMNPAGIDLGHVPYAQLGLKDNEWIEVVPLWEAPLVMNSSFLVTPGPYLTGQVVKFAFNVKNAGTLPGTWERAAIRLTVGDKLINPPDQGPFTLAPGQSRTFTFTKELAEPGTVSAKAMVRRGGVWATIDGTERFAAPVASFTVAKRSFGRVAGADRYRTAVNVSRKLFPGTAPVVVIASGQNFPDALAGAALARAEDAPLLLTPLASLPTAVLDEIVRLRPARVVILGGTKVVSWQVQKDIGALVGGTGNTSRIFGWNRYATARLVAEAIAAKTGGKVKDNTVVVATGRDFPDALAGSVLSAEEAWPVLLTEPSRLPTDTAAAIAKLGVRRTIVLGGAGVVSDDVEDALPGPVRIAGADRYDTAARVARWAESAGSLSFRYVGLATGLDFPDALAGGTLAADRGGMLLLTRPTALADPTRRLLVEHRTVTATLDAYGSTGVIPDAVFRQAREALH
jgi:putative cell wall-binding protein